MDPSQFPLTESGEIELARLQWLVDWDHPTAFENILFSIPYDYPRLTMELAASPVMARLKWRNGKSLLHCAACDNQNDLVKMLLDSGADTEAENDGFGTPLHEAIEGDNFEGVRLLLERGARVDALDFEGRSVLHKASRKVDPIITEALLRAGADLGTKNGSGETPLDVAIAWRQDEVVRLLIRHGASNTNPAHDDYINEVMLPDSPTE